jgi:hypothetical protein
MADPVAKLADRVEEQRSKEAIAAAERKRTIANVERVDLEASVRNSVPHVLRGVKG